MSKAPPSAECRQRRLAVLKEYAGRYKDKIAGWWFDGMEPDTYRAQPGDWRAIHSIVHRAIPRPLSPSVAAPTSKPVSQGDRRLTRAVIPGASRTWPSDAARLPPQEGILWHGKIYCGNVYHGKGDTNQFTDRELIDWIKTCNQPRRRLYTGLALQPQNRAAQGLWLRPIEESRSRRQGHDDPGRRVSP